MWPALLLIAGLEVSFGCGDDDAHGADAGSMDAGSTDGGAVDGGAFDGGSEVDAGPDGSTSVCPSSHVAREGRRLGFDILNETETGSFPESLAIAESLRTGYLSLHLPWSAIEGTGSGTTSGMFTDPGGALATLSTIARDHGLALALTISPIDIPGRLVPSDLAASSFADPIMQTRFRALLDYIFMVLVPDASILTSLSIGNEIDQYDWAGHGDSPADYGAFLNGIKAHLLASSSTAEVKLAFTGTLGGLTSGALRDVGTWVALAGVVDVLHVTYYPMDEGFSVRDPSVVITDIDALVDEFWGPTKPNIPLYFQEIGYQTSAVSGSSEHQQALFFCNIFQAWDTHRAEIPQMSVVRLNDLSTTAAEQVAIDYGVAGNTAFIEFIRTLGLRTHDGAGVDKEAVAIIRAEALLRGW